MNLNKFSFGLFNDTKSQAQKLKTAEISAYKALDLNEIIQVDFPDNQYYREQTPKKQIVLHHTVSGQGVDGDIAYWRQTADRIATAIIVGWDGKIYQCFSTQYWAHHIGSNSPNNKTLNMNSIGIEIDAWGGLVKDMDEKYYPALWDGKKYIPNKKVASIKNVQVYDKPFREFMAFEKYTDAQIEAVRKLLIYWRDRYNIPLAYNKEMWDYSTKAIAGTAGVWTHVSFRTSKSDCHPQPELINMLKSLT